MPATINRHYSSLVCLHDHFLGGWCWHPLTSKMTDRGYSLRLPDMPGHHRLFDQPLPEHLDDLAAQLWQGLDLGAEDRVHVLGHGFGSLVAQSIARQFGHQVRSLILCESRTHSQANALAKLKARWRPTPRVASMAKLMSKNCLESTWRQRIQQSVMAYAEQPQTFAAIWQLGQQFDSRPWLAELGMPVLLLNSQQSRQHHHALAMQKLLANAHQVQLRATGHWFMLEAPEATAMQIDAFLDQHWADC